MIEDNYSKVDGDFEDQALQPTAISRNFFDFEGIGEIEGDVPIVDEVKAYCDLVMETIFQGKKAIQNEMFGQIFMFFAVKAYDVNLSGGEMKISEYALKMVATYQDLLENLPLKVDFIDVFFSKWPGGQIPEEYKAWAQQKFTYGKNGKDDALNAWVTKEAPKYALESKEIKLKLYFGAQLIQKASDAISTIKMFHNRYYVAPGLLKSGKSMCAVFKAMKRQLLKVYTQHQGYNTLTHRKEWKTWSEEEKAQQMENYRKKRMDDWEKHGDRAYLPDAWLTFMLCSYPMEIYFPGRKMTLDCLVPPEVVQSENMMLPCKSVRRVERATAAKTKGTASATEIEVKGKAIDLTEQRTFVLVHKKEEGDHLDSAVSSLEIELTRLEKNIHLMETRGGSARVIQKLNDRMMEVIHSLMKLQKHQTEKKLQNNDIIAVLAEDEITDDEERAMTNIQRVLPPVNSSPLSLSSSSSGFVISNVVTNPAEASTRTWARQARKRIISSFTSDDAEVQVSPRPRRSGELSATSMHSLEMYGEDFVEETTDRISDVYMLDD